MTTPQTRIVFVHLLNDFSGSPRVLSQVIQAFVDKGHPVDLHTAKNTGGGFLSDLPGVQTHFLTYRWSPIKLFTLLHFILSQVTLFLRVLRYARQDAVIYVNTVLPFGAALAGMLTGKKVVYHIHETSVKPAMLKRFLFWVVKRTAHDAIYVSQFLMEQERLSGVNSHVVYNALTPDFVEKGNRSIPQVNGQLNALMLSSLKAYKGVFEYVELARSLSSIRFELVLNARQSDIDQFFEGTDLPANLILHPSQSNVHPFYQRSHVVLNLSHPLKWVETFGMTALEAMSYGLPVIVPPVGGIAELVEDGYNGYQVDVRDMETLRQKLRTLAEDSEQWGRLSQAARNRSSQFVPDQMIQHIYGIV